MYCHDRESPWRSECLLECEVICILSGPLTLANISKGLSREQRVSAHIRHRQFSNLNESYPYMYRLLEYVPNLSTSNYQKGRIV